MFCNSIPPTTDFGVRVERWIEIDKVHALGRDAVAEALEVAAVVERLRSRRVTVATGAGLDGQCWATKLGQIEAESRRNPRFQRLSRGRLSPPLGDTAPAQPFSRSASE